MSNSWYSTALQLAAQTGLNFVGSDIKALLVTDDYAPDTSATGDEFVSTISAISGAILARSASLSGKTDTGGILNCSTFAFSLVPGTHIGKYIVIYINTGNDATSRLLIVDDTAQGLPVQTNNGSITVQVDTGPPKLAALGNPV